MGGCGVWGVAGAAGGGGVRVPLRRDGRFANRPYEVWGVGDGAGVWIPGVPRQAPVPSFDFPRTGSPYLSGFLPAQEGRVGGTGRSGRGPIRVTAVGFPLSREGRFTNRPYGALGESGMLRGRKWGRPPLWIPAFAGMTMWVCGPTSAAGSGGVRFPRVGGVGVKTGVGGGCASPLWVPAIAGVTRDGGGTPGDRDAPAPRPCPGFPRERERRWGVWWDALARGVGVRVGARSRGRAVLEPPLRPGWGARGRG